MNQEDKKRFARSIRKILSNLDSDAKCFCYTNEPEFKEVKAYLINAANKLDPERTIQQNKEITFSQDEVEAIIQRTAGTMALSGFELTEEDKECIRQNAFNKEKAEQTVAELIRKHTKGE